MLILAGIYVINYWGSILLTSEIPSTSGVVGFAENISTYLRNKIGGRTGQAAILFLIALFAALFGWSIWRKPKPGLQSSEQPASKSRESVL